MTSRLRTGLFVHAAALAKVAMSRRLSAALHAVTSAKLATSRWVDALWGYDVFIAHRRSDGATYAKELYDSLTAERISCFIDRVVYGPGDSLLVATRRHVAKSTVFVLLGSPGVLAARRPVDWIEQEIDAYLTTHAADPKVVLIDFGGTIENAVASQASGGSAANPIVARVQPFLRLPENLAALSSPPSEEVLAAVRRNLDGRRRDQTRLRMFQGIAAGLTVLVVVAAALGLFAWQQKIVAQQNAERSLARQLAAQSEFLRGERAQLGPATLLAVEAVRRDPSAEADQALRSVLDILPRQTRAVNLGGPVEKAIFGPGARLLLTRSKTTAQIWDLESGKRLASIASRLGIDAMALSRDGGKFALANGCVVAVYDAKNGQQLAAAKLDQRVGSFSSPGCLSFGVMDFSPDGRLIAAAGDALVTRVWNVGTGEVQDLQHGRSAPASGVASVAFSADGTYLSSIRTGDLAVWSTADWKRSDMEPAPDWSSGEQVAFSSGRPGYLAAATGYGAGVWQFAGEQKRLLAMGLPGDRFSRAVTVAFRGNEMLAAAVNETAVVWRLGNMQGMGSGAEIARVKHQGAITALTFSPDAYRLLTGSDDGTAAVWDAQGGKEIARFVSGAPVRAAAFAAGGEVWTVDAQGVARAWEMPGAGQTMTVKGSPIEISENGTLLSVKEYPGVRYVRVWKLPVQEGAVNETQRRGPYLAVRAAGQHFFAARTENDGLRVDDLSDGSQGALLKSTDAVSFDDVLFSADGKYLTTRGQAWEVTSGRKLSLGGEGEQSTDLIFSPDSRLAAVQLVKESDGKVEAAVQVVELGSGRRLMRVPGSKYDPHIQAVFSPDGRYLAIKHPLLTIWDIRAGRALAVSIDGDTYAGFAADSRYLFAKRSSSFTDVIALDLATGRSTELKHDGGSYAYVVPSPREPLVAIAWGNNIRLWDPHTGRDVVRLDQLQVNSAAFSTDGTHLATGSRDGLVRIWARENGAWQEAARISHQGEVKKILWSADGRYLVTDIGGMTFVDQVASESPTREACERLGRSLTPDEWRQYLPGEPYRETCAKPAAGSIGNR